MALSENDEIILSFFRSAKDEVYIRIRLRDTLLAAYTTAVTATFAFAKATAVLGTTSGGGEIKEALLILPYLAFAFTLLVSYHHLCISTLGAYIKFELRANLKLQTTVQVFDNWSRFAAHRIGAQRLRSAGQAIVLLAPPITALWINLSAATSNQWILVLSFWFGVTATVAALAVVFRVHYAQHRLGMNDTQPLHERRKDAYGKAPDSIGTVRQTREL